MTCRFRVISQNVCGLHEASKHKAIFHKQKDYDIIFLHEMHWTWELDMDLMYEWHGHFLTAHGTEHSSGVAILFKAKLPLCVHRTVESQAGRYLLADVSLGTRRLLLVNVYTPNTDDLDFWNDLKALEEMDCQDIFWGGGDFYIPLDPLLDKHRGNVNSCKQTRDWLCQCMDEADWSDIWCEHHPKDFEFTHQTSARVAMHIDFFLLSQSLRLSCITSDIKPAFKSDHSTPTIQFDWDLPNVFHPFW